MNIKTLLLTTAFVASSLSFGGASAHAAKSTSQLKDFYGKIEAGLTMPTNSKIKGTTNSTAKFKKGFVGGIGAGYIVNEFFRTDLMIQYRQAKHTKKSQTQVDLTNYGAMLNGYLTSHNDTIFTPYLMAGAGLGHSKAKTKLLGQTQSKTLKKTNLIWNAGLGCQAKIHNNITADLGYRYVNLGGFGKKTIGVTQVKIKKLTSHEVLAGLTYNF
jgi:opacity protein-like surface antigen